MNIPRPSSCLAEALAKHDRERDALLAHSDDAFMAESCMAETGIGDHIAVFNHGVTYYLTVRRSQSYVDAVSPVLRWLRKRGYKQAGKPVVVSEATVNLHFTNVDRECHLSLYISMHTDEGAVCRTVKVGEVATPIFELQCSK